MATTTNHVTGAPTAKVISADEHDGHLTTTLRIDGKLVAPMSPASLHHAHDHGVIVELHRLVALESGLATFESFGVSRPSTFVGERYLFQSWWTPDQLEVARDLSGRWTEIRFRASSAVAYVHEDHILVGHATDELLPSSDALLLPKGWDHEHCTLCWAKISETPSEALAYCRGDDWLCGDCYRRYVVSGFGRLLGDVVP